MSRLSAARHALWLLILPPWRRGGERPPRRAGLVIGLAQMFGGTLLYVGGLLAFMTGAADHWSGVFWTQAQTGKSVTDGQHIAFNLSGSIGFVSFLLTPVAWIALYLMAEGLVRFVAYWVSEEPAGSLAAYPGVALHDFLRARLGRARRELRQGSAALPDRVTWSGPPAPWTLEVVTARDKPWRPEVAVQIGDDFYRLVETLERIEEGRLRVAYRLLRLASNETIRAFVPYELPPGAAAPPPSAPSPAARSAVPVPPAPSAMMPPVPPVLAPAAAMPAAATPAAPAEAAPAIAPRVPSLPPVPPVQPPRGPSRRATAG